jgi:hypothetical protein
MARINRPATMINAYGTYIINPSTYTIDENAVWSPDTGRDAFGTMQGEILALKHVFNCTWQAITPDEAKTIMRLLRKRASWKDEETEFITVTVDDLFGNVDTSSSSATTKTYEVYLGDRSISVTWYANSQQYVDLTVSLIER